jgi:hypothetical protein
MKLKIRALYINININVIGKTMVATNICSCLSSFNVDLSDKTAMLLITINCCNIYPSLMRRWSCARYRLALSKSLYIKPNFVYTRNMEACHYNFFNIDYICASCGPIVGKFSRIRQSLVKYARRPSKLKHRISQTSHHGVMPPLQIIHLNMLIPSKV